RESFENVARQTEGWQYDFRQTEGSCTPISDGEPSFSEGELEKVLKTELKKNIKFSVNKKFQRTNLAIVEKEKIEKTTDDLVI
ncbi:15360_t:CDS:2, partial [Funneliformis geosporum]